ncbi:hypothetical protein [Mycolicibacterium sp. HK-90]|uniref:hypothetical protein n=1 Tax=Mycolicibacterium sp. HK-90 TaxID=3056937 RepID=UPI00265B5262|nr:hypothetical protein [Mycolicibacterium sp. HK-90]WKG03068.1 hypothetical protein QU592_28430 [Mycolicibacterium sp. HK-90]
MIEVSVAALIVSISSAAITLGGLVAQLILYKLAGARLKVQTVFCYAEDGPRLWSATGRSRIRFTDIGFDHVSPFGIEYGRVRVTNIGRTAVSVENISFDVSRPYRARLRRRRHTVQPIQFKHKDADPKKPVPNIGEPIRLEPGDNFTAELHFWPALASSEFGTQAHKIRVRGSAHAVGRKRATRSSRRRAWTLPKGAWTVFRDVEVTPELKVFRQLWTTAYREGVASDIALLMYRDINKKLSAGATHEEIKEYLDSLTAERDGAWGNGLVAYDIHHVYHHGVPPLWRSPNRKQSRLNRWLWGQIPASDTVQ